MEFWVGIGLLERVPNQSCYGYHQISHEGDAMEISVIAPYASGYGGATKSINIFVVSRISQTCGSEIVDFVQH